LNVANDLRTTRRLLLVGSILSHSRRLNCHLNHWKKSVEGQWSSVHEEWVSERDRFTSVIGEWEMKVKGVETNLGTTEANGGSTVEGGSHLTSPIVHHPLATFFDETSTDLVCIRTTGI